MPVYRNSGNWTEESPGQWSAYRVHENDPQFFEDGMKLVWRNGPQIETVALEQRRGRHNSPQAMPCMNAQEILRPSLTACHTSVWLRQVVTPPRAPQQEHLRTRKYGATLGTMFGDAMNCANQWLYYTFRTCREW